MSKSTIYIFQSRDITKCGLFIFQIYDEKLEFTEKAGSKVGSMDKVTHKPGGGDKKVGVFLYLSLVVRKPVFGGSDQVRHKSGCAATEDG